MTCGLIIRFRFTNMLDQEQLSSELLIVIRLAVGGTLYVCQYLMKTRFIYYKAYSWSFNLVQSPNMIYIPCEESKQVIHIQVLAEVRS